MKQFATNTLDIMAPSPAFIMRFNQLVLFHSLMLLALSLLATSWLEQLHLIDHPWIWGLVILMPIAVSLSLLFSHQVNRYSLSGLFGVWMLLWILG